jgi:hypothetical protein
LEFQTPDYGHRRFPKHVGFYDKNKFWILMHLVGYFYEAFHDARSPEHKVWCFSYMESSELARMIKLITCVWEVSFLNMGWGTICSDWSVCGFYQADAGTEC